MSGKISLMTEGRPCILSAMALCQNSYPVYECTIVVIPVPYLATHPYAGFHPTKNCAQFTFYSTLFIFFSANNNNVKMSPCIRHNFRDRWKFGGKSFDIGLVCVFYFYLFRLVELCRPDFILLPPRHLLF